MTAVIYVAAALAEIVGCFAFWGWLRLDKPLWWVVPGTIALVVFALLLTRVESTAAGCAFAAYGGVYIATSLAWFGRLKGSGPIAGM